MPKLEMAEETQKILDHLQKYPQTFTYKEMQALTGVNDLTRLRGYITTVLRRLRNDGVWYQSLRGVGYRLLDEDAKNPVQSKGLDKTRRAAKRLSKNQDTIRVEALTREGQYAYSFNSARIGRLMQATGRKVKNEIERQMKNGDLPLPDKKKP